MTNFDWAYVEHQRRGQKPTDDWQTPPHILKALGRFDLDPCASTEQQHRTADTMWTVLDGGFMKPWRGRVWLNPPYGSKTTEWVRRLGDHGNGIALVFARVDTALFQDEIFVRATGLLFLRKRLFFIQRDGSRAKSSGGAPSVLVAYGEANMHALRISGLKGSLVDLQIPEVITRYARPRINHTFEIGEQQCPNPNVYPAWKTRPWRNSKTRRANTRPSAMNVRS